MKEPTKIEELMQEFEDDYIAQYPPRGRGYYKWWIAEQCLAYARSLIEDETDFSRENLLRKIDEDDRNTTR